jgi:tetratricopeptide (TPR) repeat protein
MRALLADIAVLSPARTDERRNWLSLVALRRAALDGDTPAPELSAAESADLDDLCRAYRGDTALARRLASAVGPVDVWLAAHLAERSEAAGDLADARDWCERVLAEIPDVPAWLQRRARVLTRQGDWPTAVEAWERAIAAMPANAKLLPSYCWALQQVGRDPDAERVARAAASALPDNPQPQAHLARILRRRGDLDGACAALDQAIRLAPDNRHFQDLRRAWRPPTP